MWTQRPTRHDPNVPGAVRLGLRVMLTILLPGSLLLLQACSDLPQWLKPPRAVADSTGKVVVDCRDFWPLNRDASTCAVDASSACDGPVIYMRTINSSGPPPDTSIDGLSDFRAVYQCRRNVEGRTEQDGRVR